MECARDLDEAVERAALRRIELDAHDPFVLAERLRERRLACVRRRREREGRLVHLEQRSGRPARLEGVADRLDLGGRGPATPADDPRSERDGLHGELREVVRGRMGVDDAPPCEAGEADVGQGREREACVLHPAQCAEGDGRAGPMVGSDRGDPEAGEALRCGLGADAAGDLRLVVEGEERDDRKRRDRAHRLHCDDELVEVEERLDHEQVDAAPFEHAGLRRVERAVLGRIEDLELTERADRARDEDVAAGDLPCLSCEPHACGVDLLEGVVEERPRELAAVRAEGVRLDQLRSGCDVARVNGDHALGRAEVRFFRAPEAVHGARDQRAHATVRDERRAVLESIEETAHGSATLDPARLVDRTKRGCRRAPLRRDRLDGGAVPPRAEAASGGAHPSSAA